jgi:hypothetical protein
MVKLTSDDFFSLQTQFSSVPYTLSHKWYNYLISKGEKFVFYADHENTPNITIMGKVKKIPLIGNILRIQGELISENVSDKLITDFYKNLIQLPYQAIEINSINVYSISYEIGVRRAGFIRPLYLLSCPLSIVINLTNPIEYNLNWKKNYKRAIKSELEFYEYPQPKYSDLLEFSKVFKEMATRTKIGYNLEVGPLIELIDGKSFRYFGARSKEGNLVAGRIIYVNANTSYDIYAASSNIPKNNGASYFLVQSIMEKLSGEGIQKFDFGQIPPSSKPIDGIYYFKNCVKGTKVQYCGEWAFYKSQLKEYIMLLLRKTIANPLRY